MLIGWWVAVLLVTEVEVEAQSGDGDPEPRISCTSDIMMSGSSLTCRLPAGGGRDDDDEDDDEDDEDGGGIERMSVCYSDFADEARIKCVEGSGDTVSSEQLLPLMVLNLTVHFKSGRNFSTSVRLDKIVKPRSPWVSNVTFDQENSQVVIHVQTPHHNDHGAYLNSHNQEFQLHIFSAKSNTTQSISSKDFLPIDIGHFDKHTVYHVRVRAIPQKLQGSWSEWSDTFSFSPPAGEKTPDTPEDTQLAAYTLIVCLVSVVMLTSGMVVVFWKKKIFTYMWPSIPHPKHTLVQICKPNKGLLLNLNPEVISALNVYPPRKTGLEEPEPTDGRAAADDQSSNPCSTQSSDCRSATSASTELSALLSRSSSDGEDGLQSTAPSPANVPRLMERPRTPPAEPPVRGNEAEAAGKGPQEEAYVTMSSFYQIK